VSSPAPTPPGRRRLDIDALRIGACLTQFVYHTGKVFDTDPIYHVKNDVLSSTVTAVTTFTHLWRMPLFFVLAGWAAATVLRHRDAATFRRGRARRLAPPLLFGIVVLCPPIKYVERLGGIDNRPSGHYPGEPFALGFLEFLPRFFFNIRDFSWSHMWFLAYLLLFSLLLAPLLHRIVTGRDRLDSGRWLAYAPLLPLVLLETTLRPAWGSFPNLYADWASLAVYLTYFLAGALLAREARADTLASECRGLGLLGLAALGGLAAVDSPVHRDAGGTTMARRSATSARPRCRSTCCTTRPPCCWRSSSWACRWHYRGNWRCSCSPRSWPPSGSTTRACDRGPQCGSGLACAPRSGHCQRPVGRRPSRGSGRL
jgi:hypothetical protein